MKFVISQVRDAGTVRQEETADPKVLLGTPPDLVSFGAPVTSRVSANLTHEGDLVLSGKVETVVSFVCGRCLEGFDRPRKIEFQQVITPTGDEVDINADIREAVFLDLPVSAVCRESCKGICSHCGTNLNNSSCSCETEPAHSSWDALKQIRFK